MKIYKITILILIITACGRNVNDKYIIKNHVDNFEKSTFVKDFNIFKREGIRIIESDTLEFPFFQIIDLNDTCLELVLHKPKKERMIVPKGNQMMYIFHDITDGPRHIYYKIFADKIVTYEYEEKVEKVINSNRNSTPLYTLLPQVIKIIKQDSIYIYFSDCFTTMDINTIINRKDFSKLAFYPFQIELNEKCDKSMTMFFDDKGQFCHYYNDKENSGTFSREQPGVGLYGYKREYMYWRDYFNLHW